MSTPVLEATGLIKTFPGVRAVDGVNLTLRAGQIHALLGENGAGKSTLIKILTGVHRHDGGTLTVAGDPVRFGSPLEALHAGIGVVHQERNVVPQMSIAENIVLQNLPQRWGVVDRAAVRTRARAALERLDLDLDPDRPIAGLSAAQVQLVEIAKALDSESAVLLLDEPTASITPNEAEVLFRTVRGLAEAGTSVVFVSHKLDEVFALCDTVTVLRDGRGVVESQPLSQFSHDDILNHMVGRAMEALRFPPRTIDHSARPALSLHGVCTDVGHRDIDLDVRSGEIVALYGLVGAGRSELARALIGLHEITAGEVRVQGEPVRVTSVREAIGQHRIGYVSENRKEEGVFLDQSVQRNIAATTWSRMTRLLSYVPAKAERAAVDEQIAALGIKVSSPEQPAGQLSGGNQQKVSLAKWLAARPDILIIDEPTIGIDVRTKAAFHELIWELAQSGLAVLLISSDLHETITLADRIVVFRDYRVTAEIDNDHDYDTTSAKVIRAIHATSGPATPVGSRMDD
ncbi:sugar ABC transporter ATP-binding protein [Nonomuraea sp. NPDC004354]